METRQEVRLTVDEGIARLTLAAPPLNILTAALMRELDAALRRAGEDREVKAVALAAEGRAFSAGADVGEHRPEQARDMIAAFSALFDTIDALEVPLVAAVGGAALGAGFELAMSADIVVAADSAKFGQPEIRLGFFAPLAVARLPYLVGPARAVEITATGRTYTAEEMHRMGLVSRVVPRDGLDAALEEVLADLRRASPLVMRMNVRRIRAQMRAATEARHEAERRFLDELMATEDVREGIASFFEKRAPQWRNR
ncbi:MAG: enoyl-CoA hydratase/isomerase family protein [Acidobacteria bacterium]|nr:MAG: enoyl-CoA hydratase/isomerase family protein [Acidobacteriota bacterium]